MESIKKAGQTIDFNQYKREPISLNLHSQQTDTQNRATLSSTIVTISEQGRDKLDQESEQSNSTQSNTQKAEKSRMELGQSVAKQLYASGSPEAKKFKEEEEEKDALDKMIDNLKEQIEEITLQLKEMDQDGSEQALEQKELLGNQLMELNGQLLRLMAEKLKQE